MRLLVLAVVGVALGVVVRVVLGRRRGEDEPMAPLRVVPSSNTPSSTTSRPSDGAAPSPAPAPAAEDEKPRRPAPGLDASAGWEELTATSIGSRPDR